VGGNGKEARGVREGLRGGGLCGGGRQRGEPPLDLSRELGPNRVLGPYQIEAELGGGSFGTVFRARDLALDREVALKVLRPGSPVPATALLAEARAAAALNHPNICIIHAVDSSEGVSMIVMEYIAGEPLSKLMGRGPWLHPQGAVWGRQVALGMASAHAQGVVHSDLNPANVLVTPTGTVKIVDFGMARRNRSPIQTDETGVWDPGPPSGISGTP